MAWAGLGCLNFFINSVVWNHSIANVAPVWCDICPYNSTFSRHYQFADLPPPATRFIVGLSVGILASLLVINRRLYKIATRSVISLTPAEKRRDIFIDLAIGLGIPILHMAMGAFLPRRFPSSVLMVL